MDDRVAGGGEVALEMDPRHRVPLLLAHVDQHPVAQEAGVAHERVEAAPRVDGLSHHGAGQRPVGHIGVVDGGRPARGGDLGGHGGGSVIDAGQGAVVSHTEVVDQHVGALGREGQGMGPSQTPAGAGDDHDPPVAAAHDVLPSRADGTPGRD